MNMKKIVPILCMVLMAFSWGCETGGVSVVNPRCEMLVNPEGIDVSSPRLSWEIQSEEKGVLQTGYHILVASSKEKLNRDEGDLWDSGKVNSNKSTYVPYMGKTLNSREECYWKVKVYTNKGESNWSKSSKWTMGLLKKTDWSAVWIGTDRLFENEVLDSVYTRLTARYLRKEFSLNKKVEKAVLYVSGLGLYEAWINGRRVGTQVLAPTPTDYTKRVNYNTFDVTDIVAKGKNAIGVTLGNGHFYSMRYLASYMPSVTHFGFPKLILQLEVTYNDGTKQIIVSDRTWKLTNKGPIRFNNEWDGEEYDARMEMPGWTEADFDDKMWMPVELVTAPKGKLVAQKNANMQIMEIVKPVSITQQGPATYILDMGQNMVGWVSMKVKGKAGDKVTLRFAELLKDDGSLYMDNLRGAKVTDTYTLKGDVEESWEPSFVYHGFRFVEIINYPGVPDIKDFSGKVIYDEMPVTGTFHTSDSTINQIYKNAYWGIRGNYNGMPTDCPQRDERHGWLGDRATGSLGESFIFDNNNLYSKWLDDIEDSQRADGSIPDVAPAYWSIYTDNITWPSAYIFIANMLYQQYGNDVPIKSHYTSMKKWLSYMKSNYMDNGIITKDTYGDWCMPPELPEMIHSQDPKRKTDGGVLSTAVYYKLMTVMQNFANILGKTEDAEAFAQEAQMVKVAFNNKYFNRDAGQYSNNTVTANLLPLCYGMVSDEFIEMVFNNIVHKTENEFNSHVSTGLVGIQWLMRGLSDYGRADLALKIATNRDYPSWGYMIENGATTIWELWNGNTAEPSMNSGNHVMLLGDLIVWYYEYLAGIKNAEGSAGFEKIELKPWLISGLEFVDASYKSVKGLIKSSWVKKGNTFEWGITIPANTTAVVYIPANGEDKIKINGEPSVSMVENTQFISYEKGYLVYEFGSGSYNIVAMKE